MHATVAKPGHWFGPVTRLGWLDPVQPGWAGWIQSSPAGLDPALKKKTNKKKIVSFSYKIQFLWIYLLVLKSKIPYFLGYIIFTNARVGNII